MSVYQWVAVSFLRILNSPGCYVISLKFFSRGSSYTFLESLEPIQLQEQCCHFFRHRPLTFLAVTTSGFTVFRGYTSGNATFWIGVRTKKGFYDQNTRVLKIWAKPEVPFLSYGLLNTGLNDIFVIFVRISFVEKTQTNLTQSPYKYLLERLEKGFVLYLNKYMITVYFKVFWKVEFF